MIEKPRVKSAHQDSGAGLTRQRRGRREEFGEAKVGRWGARPQTPQGCPKAHDIPPGSILRSSKGMSTEGSKSCLPIHDLVLLRRSDSQGRKPLISDAIWMSAGNMRKGVSLLTHAMMEVDKGRSVGCNGMVSTADHVDSR